METIGRSPRRGFIARIAGAVAALTAAPALVPEVVAVQPANDAGWIAEVRGKSRCFFDCPQHANGMGLLHILNYLGAYPAGQSGVVSSFYGVGPAASIPLGFNDAMWAKYGLGELMGLKDAAGRPYTRNVFATMGKDDAHLLAQRAGIPASIALLGQAAPALSIPSLQKMGTKFLVCNNALGLWTLELEARGKGTADAIGADMRANVLPGVTIVPAMVRAIEQAHAAGFSYNRQ